MEEHFEPFLGASPPEDHSTDFEVTYDEAPLDDPTFDDLSRKDTITSKATSEDNHPTCRICRSEGTPEEPLFHPCKCSGSIQYVHQECLMEWLSHSHKKHCELCKTPFRFTKLYDADMPAQLPWDVFIKRALIHVGQGVSNTARGILVGIVWMIILPFSIRFAWRWMFWTADAGWARDLYLYDIKRLGSEGLAALWSENSSLAQAGQTVLGNGQTGSANEVAYNAYNDFMNSLGFDWTNTNSTGTNQTAQASQWPQADTSIFSSWSYLSELTPNARLNRALLDIFEGQLITCVVIIGFILIFLIREWVVQQQPLVNMEQLNNVQQQLREAADRVQEENDRFRRQQELLDQARRRLLELQRETEDAQRQTIETLGGERPEFIGWDRLEETIDAATEMLSQGDREGFETQAPIVTEQIRAAGYEPGTDLDAFTDRVYAKLASFPDAERREWESVLVADIRRKNERSGQGIGQSPSDDPETPESERTEEDFDAVGRPPMPERDFSSRATQIQRLLEEADGIFSQVHGDAATREEAPSEQPISTEAGPSTARSSSTESWQSVSRPGEPSSTVENAEGVSGSYDVEKEEIPITNAGPNAKINIKRSGKGKARAVPEPKTEDKNSPENKAKSKVDEKVKELEQEIAAEDATTNDQNLAESQDDQPANPDGTHTDTPIDDSLAGRVGSAFREEFGLEEAVRPDSRHLAGPGNDASNQETASPNEESDPRPDVVPQHGIYERVADWFWGDIQATNGPEPVPAAREERLDGQAAARGAEAPHVHNDNMEPGRDQRPENENNALPEQRDPEVVAAAAQAGLDAEAVEDAEDLEGIFELIGLQGPLTALLQTSMFCLVLVSGTVFSAVGLPYVFGKLVLSFIGSPVYFFFKMPLQMASFIADFIIDTSLFIGGWSIMVVGLLSEVLHKAIGSVVSVPPPFFIEKMTNASMNTATASGTRLQHLFITDTTGDLGWSGAFLGASVHSHASLRALQDETNAVLSFTGRCITSVVDTVSSGSFTTVWEQLKNAAAYMPAVPAQILAGVQAIMEYVAPLIEALATLKTGALTLNVPSNSPASIDPSLIFWSSSDRMVAVVTGYIALAMVAALYVAADTPITRSATGQRHEKMIRDTLRQAGGVLKVILIISIEMLMFPLYCGLLLDVAFLPLFGGASMSTRLAFAASKPYTFCFTHWFVGTCYMFHFALFVGMCRKILRKGVLWFIRDPDDPTFHPVRDVLERNVVTQLRKIAFSALVYGALVILCLGGVIWTIGKLFRGIFPIQWITTEPVLEFPVDLLLYNFVTPLLVRLFKPSDTVNMLYAWWLRRCARVLRLSHFMFDDRRKDEEGHHVHRTWTSLLLMRQADTKDGIPLLTDDKLEAPSDATPDVYLQRDGKYVLTPCSDQYRPPKAGEAFLHTDDEDVYIVDKEGKKNEHFAKMYVPPLFRVRVTLFLVCLWLFSATTGLCATLVPLVFGRRTIQWVFPGVKVNDIYAYTIGAYTLSGVIYAALKSSQAVRQLREKAQAIDLRAWSARAVSIASRVLKCTYVYGFLGIALPTFFAFILQFYIILPLHTYLVASAHEQATLNATASASNSTTSHLFNQTDPATPAKLPTGPWLASHNIHLLQDFALGLLYCRIVSRALVSAPSSRAAEAFRRITATGYLDPNARLATRFFILPSLLLAVFTFALPPAGAWLFITASAWSGVELPEDVRTLVYRYSYPALGAVVVALLLVIEVSRATERWRARVRDEVYLVGERLHNFGEKKPPAGTKSVVRRDRVGGRREVDLDF
jgi:E3 ubiquitin-protein ligase MARCH6